MKQDGCRDLEGREGWRRRTRRTFSPSSHAGHRRVDHVEEVTLESPRKFQDVQMETSETAEEMRGGRNQKVKQIR